MARLEEILTQPEVRPKVVGAVAELIDAEVKSKSGLSALAIKAGYKLVCAIKPSMVTEVVDRLLPEFAAALEPLYVDSQRAGGAARPLSEKFESQMVADPARTAGMLLTVTDARAAKASGALRKTYDRLRDTADAHVRTAVPGLARTLAPFVR
jgi:hypothetical protein